MIWRQIAVVALVLQGCATPLDKTSPTDRGATKSTARDVVILVSENIPAYSSVATALTRQLGREATLRYMSGNALENTKMVAAYKDDEQRQIVSIGLKASIAAKALTKRRVVFCQVFNYQDYELVTATHKGVSMVPSISKTFSIWRTLAPDTKDIGVITGPGFDDTIQIAREAAKTHGFILHYEVVKSDKEYQYAYKQLADKVQGYWLLPDNRVLSRNVLRDVMAFSVSNSKQVVVFSDELLNLGGLFSTTADYRDIAQQVLERLNQAANHNPIPGPDLAHLDKLILRVNGVMADRLNLTVPPQYRKHEQIY